MPRGKGNVGFEGSAADDRISVTNEIGNCLGQGAAFGSRHVGNPPSTGKEVKNANTSVKLRNSWTLKDFYPEYQIIFIPVLFYE
jgi:hypothetical protein